MRIEAKFGGGKKGMTNARKWALMESVLFVVLGGTPMAYAQQAPPSKPEAAAGEISHLPAKPEKNSPKPEHRFWDKKNDWLFAGVGAARTLDYFSTLNLRRRGDQELLVTNDLVDDHAAFAVVEAAGTGVSIGASYLFHRYGHHKLERWTSIVHIGLTTTGAARNYYLKTAHHPATGP
jgi:hypothetical protein